MIRFEREGTMVAENSPETLRRPIEVGILAVPQATASPIYGMQEVLASAGRDWDFLMQGTPGEGLINASIVSMDGEPMELSNGGWVKPAKTLDDRYCPDALCILEVVFDPASGPGDLFARETRWLKDYWRKDGLIATACTGAVLLGEAGLLAGEDATTHWGFCDFMARRYPGVRMHPERALVASGTGQRLIMSGGGTSWMDLGLYLIARFCSQAEAVRVAKVHLIEWHETGQQPFASVSHQRQSDDAVIGRCQQWVAHHYDQPSPVAGMISLSGLSERSFHRRFRQATGMTPIDYVLTLRLEEAKQILETSKVSVEAVAEMVGYQDAAFFSRKFQQRVGLTPAQYRRKFGGVGRLPANE
ncbi:GlxA family transcriptional regulator [Marinobacter guineae]|nr:helix-turn-helix domain-containing protein [Marinobacter guineae]